MEQLIQLKGREDGPHGLILAGVHGDEYEPIVALLDLVHELRDGWLRRGTVIVDHLANPSACKLGTRTGEDGLDLARICPGDNHGSPSQRAAFAVSERIQQADFLIDLHTGGLAFDIFPLVGYMLHPHPAVLDAQRKMALASGMPLIWGTDYHPMGRTLSVAREAGVPAVYMEFGGGSGFRKAVVDRYKNAVKRILACWGMAMAVPEMDAPEDWSYWLEDARTDSGFLQGQMPAPVSGIFVPAVNVGEFVHENQLFGHIIDTSTGRREEVLAPHDGLVFLLRDLVAVGKGDALGGIMAVKRRTKLTIDGK